MTFEELANGIALPGCPEYLVEQALLRGAQQFARDTLIWEAKVTTTVLEGEPVDLVLPMETRVASITYVTVDDKEVTYVYADDAIDVGDAEGTLVVWAALEPTEDAIEIPEKLVPWWPAIQAYARADLLSMEGQEWTDLNAAALRMALYTHKMHEARLRRAQGQTTQPMRVRMPDFI